MKTWFITGTSTGFGRTLTEMLLERGDRVAATLRDVATLDALKSRYSQTLWTAALDVTDSAAVRTVVDRAFTDLGRIDVVVSNAGFAVFGAAEEASDEQIAKQFATNLVGSMQVIRASLPHLRAQGGGRILQISSAGGQTTYPNFSVYHASKWGIEGFVETLAKEVAPFGIACTIVEPGATKTNFAANKNDAPRMSEYDATPAGEMRDAIARGEFVLVGDARKMCRTIVDAVDANYAPLRLPMGSDTYRDVRASLVARLAALDAAKDVALSTDA